MIVKMAKYTFLVYHHEYNDFLMKLRDLGVVHIKEIKPTKEIDELQNIISVRKKIDTTLKQFAQINKTKSVGELDEASLSDMKDGKEILDKVEDINESLQHLEQDILVKGKDLEIFNIWGEFHYSDIDKLRNVGYEVKFFTCPNMSYQEKWEADYNAFDISEYQSLKYFVTINKMGTEIDIDAEIYELPKQDYFDIKEEYDKLNHEKEVLLSELENIARKDYNNLLAYDLILKDNFNLSNAKVQVRKEADDKLIVLEGWVPKENVDAVKKTSDEDGYYYLEQAIEEGDKVPIKLKNNSFSRLFEPITKMFSLPNYGELDQTPLFAPFFMLFFGMCFGDAGYGLFVFLVCTILKPKSNADMKPVMSLFQVLGGAAFFIGMLSGSFFGVSLAEVDAFKSVKSYFLNSDNLMTISVVIGLIQIIFGKVVAAIKIKMQKGTKYSIAPFAWTFVITFGLLAVALGKYKPDFSPLVTNIFYGIAILGFAVALFYNTPGKNPLLNFGTGLWNTYNTVSGLLGDTLSYIRLFAIGLTGAILGSVFNTLAIEQTAGMNIFVRIIVMLLILLVGHAINFGLTMIGSLVHPLRLVFVEYFKNSEFEGGGESYTPFKKS